MVLANPLDIGRIREDVFTRFFESFLPLNPAAEDFISYGSQELAIFGEIRKHLLDVMLIECITKSV